MPDDGVKSPEVAYRQMIDSLVENTPLGSGQLVREQGRHSNAHGAIRFNEFVARLSQADRILLAEICEQERESGTHDALSELTWWILCEDLELVVKGKPLPVDQSGMGLHGDYIGRRTDWPWPPADLKSHWPWPEVGDP